MVAPETFMDELRSIPRKRLMDGLKIALPAVIIVAVAFGFLRRANQMFLPVTLDFATAAAIGITSGLATRWSLKGRAGLLHVLVAVSTTIIGLIILGLVTFGQAGIRMLTFRSDVDWNALGQVSVGASSAMLALRAWRRHIQISSIVPPERAAPRVVAPLNKLRSRNRRPRVRNSRRAPAAAPIRIASMRTVSRIIALPRWHLPHIMVPHWSAPRLSLPNWHVPQIALPQLNVRNWLQNRDSAIKVNGITEQRCPYCLDEIVRNDPRGVHVCPICHTPHHADCWAMTGMCQIPHYHA
jgi:hypothetical protein